VAALHDAGEPATPTGVRTGLSVDAAACPLDGEISARERARLDGDAKPARESAG
jgi:hypothetical protein